VPFHPADFAILEIEIQKAPAIRGRFCFAVSISLQRKDLASAKSFAETNLAITPLDGHI
jgi:hypothetical protein